MDRRALVVSLVLAVLGLIVPKASAQIVKDACALLQPADAQKLAGPVKVGPAKSEKEETLGMRSCTYEWGTGGNVQSGRTYLKISATPMAKALPGVDPKAAQQGLLASGARGNSGVISGVGEAAVYDSNAEIRMTTTAFAKGIMVVVELETMNARTKKDQVIALLKEAVGRL